MSSLILTAGRVVLRPLSPADAGGPYLQWMNDYDVTKYLESRFRRFTEEDLRTYIARFSDRMDAVFLGIFLADTGRHIGNIKLEVSLAHRRGEMGIVIGDKMQWGKGYAPEAIRSLSDHAFKEMKLHKLTAGCYGNNQGSQRAFEKAGFGVEGRRARHFQFEGQWVDLILLARFAPEDCSTK